MTLRERAEAMYRMACVMPRTEVVPYFEEQLAEHVRALLSDDEATIEEMARAAYGGVWRTRSEETQAGYIAEARAALAALRRKACGSAGRE